MKQKLAQKSTICGFSVWILLSKNNELPSGIKRQSLDPRQVQVTAQPHPPGCQKAEPYYIITNIAVV